MILPGAVNPVFRWLFLIFSSPAFLSLLFSFFLSVSPLFSSLRSVKMINNWHKCFVLFLLSMKIYPFSLSLFLWLWTVSWPTPPCGSKERCLFTAAVKEHRKMSSRFGFFFSFSRPAIGRGKASLPNDNLKNNDLQTSHVELCCCFDSVTVLLFFLFHPLCL